MSMDAAFIATLAELGLNADQLSLAAALVDHREDGRAILEATLSGLRTSNRIDQAPTFVEDLAKALLAIPYRKASAPYTRRLSSYRPPSGVAARYGYDGPETPRLPENEWWPLRGAILRRDGGVCQYCGEAPERMCVDHVVPLSRGGTNDHENLVACCIPCNSSKSDRLLDEWRGRFR